MSNKCIIFSVCALLLTTSFSGFAEKTFLVGADLTNPPFQFRNKDGNPDGFEIELTNALCKSENVKCIYVVNNFDAQIPALIARKVDFILPLSVTPKRQKAIDFTDYVFHLPTRLVAKKDSNIMPQVKSLKDKIIAVQQGSIQEAYAEKYWRPAGINIKNYQDPEAIYEDLVANRVDAALYPSVAVSYGFLKTHAGEDFELKGPEVTDADLFSKGSAFGVRKGDYETKTLLNKGLDNIMRNTKFSNIQKKYFGDQDLKVK